jgi:hypothetical protein
MKTLCWILQTAYHPQREISQSRVHKQIRMTLKTPLVVFYDIHESMGEVLFFSFVLMVLNTIGARWSSGQCARRAIAEA